MIITGKIDRVLNGKSGSIVSFAVPAFQARYIDELDIEKEFKLEITEMKTKRSLQQNKYIWKLISEISRKENIDDMEIYCQIIKMAKIKTVFLETVPEAKKDLEKAFRGVIERDTRTSTKGIQTVVYECLYGTSTFDTSEMSEFIDRLLDYAEQVGVSLVGYYDVY